MSLPTRPSIAVLLALAASFVLVATGAALLLIFIYSVAMIAVSVAMIAVGAGLLWWGMKRLHLHQKAADNEQ
ncbi:MAG: hypothetical protein E1N59_1096 [Puniceicoccaceae bacterium 5H]|nr:MAG: hypothetical protein E1N59_1096 [Puniceicoccaceae bacterium 5H]